MQLIKIDCPQTTTCHGNVFLPKLVIFVKLYTGNYQLFEFIVDSGSDCTIVPKGMANLVGILLPATPDTYMRDASGRSSPAYKGKLSVRLQGETFDVRCLFTDFDTSPMLLGRLDFFDRYDIHFKGRKSSFEITKHI